MEIRHTNSQSLAEKEGEEVEEGRRKIMACLIFVVAVAVIIGTIYYVHDVKGSRKVNEGTLIENTIEKIVLTGTS